MDSGSLKPNISTFGCKVNTYDSGLLTQRLQKSGLFRQEDLSQVFIVNSCAVTQEATKEALRQARRLKRKNPGAKVVFTGCAAQVDGDLVDQEEALDLVIANSHKAEVPELIHNLLSGQTLGRVHRANIFRKDDLGKGGGEEESHSRAFLKIQDGCNSFCSFCVIPYARGTSRSLSINHLIERVHELQSGGYQEVVLTGVHIGDYQDPEEKGRGLEDLVENLLNFCTVPRLRLTSLEPIEITPRLLELYENPRLCPHFHISLQSAHTGVLKAMKRKYSAQDVEAAFERIFNALPQTPFIGMDVIAGFPGETEKDFLETYRRLEQLPWNYIHVFPYSERKGTRAAELMEGSVPWQERKERAKALRELSEERYRKTALEQVGKRKKVLLSKKGAQAESQFVQGVARDFWKVNLPFENGLDLSKEQEVIIQGFDLSSRSTTAPLLGRWAQ